VSAKKKGGEVDRFQLTEVIPATRDFIALDAERCTGCGDCVVVCPMELWRLREGKAALARDYRKKCTECGSCYIACEAGAIDFAYPPGGTGVVYKYS
jgi:ferredoxin-like protein FixX